MFATLVALYLGGFMGSAPLFTRTSQPGHWRDRRRVLAIPARGSPSPASHRTPTAPRPNIACRCERATDQLPITWLVMIADRYLEQYEFSCNHCSYMWHETFEVREIEDSDGGSWHYFYLAGSPATSPSMRDVCPSCKQTNAQHRQIDRRQIQVPDDL